ALTDRPFGEPKRVAKAAAALARWADKLAATLSSKPVTQAEARRIAEAIPKRFAGQPLDYDSARQVAWALEGFTGEGGGSAPAGAFRALGKQLRLRLPEGRMPKDATEGTIVRDLPRNLEALNAFDADAFARQLRTFRPFPMK